MSAKLENSAVATGLEKVSFHSNPKERQCPKCSNYHTTALISHASKVMLKILQARLQQYVNLNFQMFKLVLEKTEEPEIKLPTSAGSWKKQKSSRKTSISASLVAQRLKHLHGMWETQVRSLGWEDPLEKEMATRSSTLAWRIPWR